MGDVVAVWRKGSRLRNNEFPTGMGFQIIWDEVVGWDLRPKVGSKDVAFVRSGAVHLVNSLLSEGAGVISARAKRGIALTVSKEFIIGFVSVMLMVILGCGAKERKPFIAIITKRLKHGLEEGSSVFHCARGDREREKGHNQKGAHHASREIHGFAFRKRKTQR